MAAQYPIPALWQSRAYLISDRDMTREIIRATALNHTPHGFLSGVGHSGEPDPNTIAPGELVLVRQVHSAKVVHAEAPFATDARPEADALVTATSGLVLGIVTADCAPVLFADSDAGVIGAAHAGWRGAHSGVLEATVLQMEALGATRANITAAIGPTIAQANYEVDHDFFEQFDESDRRFFVRGKPGKWQFDLPAYVGARLDAIGLGTVEDLAIDTYADPARFHSYRRATHRGEPTKGRQFSLIALPVR